MPQLLPGAIDLAERGREGNRRLQPTGRLHGVAPRRFRVVFMKSLIPLVLGLVTFAARAADHLVLLPSKIKLSGVAARQQLLVELVRDKLFVGQITNDVALISSDRRVVKIEDGAAVPMANGVATITVKHGKQVAKAQVTVEGVDTPFDWSFRNHVQSVLAKAGCSSGACH